MVAAAIIPNWRFTEFEPEPPVISLMVALVLTLVLVVVLLFDLACTLLCARWERFTQVIFFVAYGAESGFLHLSRWLRKLVRVVSYAGLSKFVTV